MKIRPFQPGDTDQVARLFHETIRSVNSKDYSDKQLRAWAPDDIHFKDWESFCLSKHTFVADDKGTIAGFAQLEENGYIDCFYCHKDYQRKGVGSKLYKKLEQKAFAMHLSCLYTGSSITALPFFKSKGFKIIRKQQVYKAGEQLTNFKMEKTLKS